MKDAGFSYQPGDSLRITAFLDGYFTYPHGSSISDSKAVEFDMLKSTAEITGISDTYKPIAEGTYTVLEFDTITGGTSFILLTDTVELRPGNILTLDLDTLGVIQRVVRIREDNGDVIVDTEPGYMDELFVEASFELDTRIMEPKFAIKSDSPPQEIIEALTDDRGRIHPVKVIYFGEGKTTTTWSAFEDHPGKEHRENIIHFHEDFSGTDLYNMHNTRFYIDQGYASLKADAVFAFEFQYQGELTDDTKVKKGDLEFFKFTLDSEAGFQTKLALDMEASIDVEGSQKLQSLASATAVFIVSPGIPVWITFGVDIMGGYEFTADAALNADWGFESLHRVEAGGLYERSTNDFSPIWEYEAENTVYPLNIQGEVNAFARLELFPRTDVRMFGFFGPFTEIAPFVQGQYNALLQSQDTSLGEETFLAWDSGIDLGLDLRVGTSLSFLWGYYETDFGPVVINCFNWPLWSSPVELQLLTEIPEQIQGEETLDILVRVVDVHNDPVPHTTVLFEGDGEFSTQLPMTGSDGIASVRWIPGEELGHKAFWATIFKADNSVIGHVYASTQTLGNPPVASFSASPTTGTVPLVVGFSDESTNYPEKWQWDFGDGHTSTEQNPLHTYYNPGTYTIELIVENNDGADTLVRTNYITVSERDIVYGDGVTDIDGNHYVTVIINNLEWIAQNLRVTRYSNGDAIPAYSDNAEWEDYTVGAYTVRDHQGPGTDGINTPEEMVAAYGKLYNWYAVDDPRGLCPEGWRVASIQDWAELIDYVVEQGYPNEGPWENRMAGNALKSCRQMDSPLGGDCTTSEHPRWESSYAWGPIPIHYGLDHFGFSALPAGYSAIRNKDEIEHFVGVRAHFWTATKHSSGRAFYTMIGFGRGDIPRIPLFSGPDPFRYYDFSKEAAQSVRCVRE